MELYMVTLHCLWLIIMLPSPRPIHMNNNRPYLTVDDGYPLFSVHCAVCVIMLCHYALCSFRYARSQHYQSKGKRQFHPFFFPSSSLTPSLFPLFPLFLPLSLPFLPFLPPVLSFLPSLASVVYVVVQRRSFCVQSM